MRSIHSAGGAAILISGSNRSRLRENSLASLKPGISTYGRSSSGAYLRIASSNALRAASGSRSKWGWVNESLVCLENESTVRSTSSQPITSIPRSLSERAMTRDMRLRPYVTIARPLIFCSERASGVWLSELSGFGLTPCESVSVMYVRVPPCTEYRVANLSYQREGSVG